MHSQVQTRLSPDEAHDLASWMAEAAITMFETPLRDVAGQYGPHGFMLILPESTNVGSVYLLQTHHRRAVLEAKDGPLFRSCKHLLRRCHNYFVGERIAGQSALLTPGRGTPRTGRGAGVGERAVVA